MDSLAANYASSSDDEDEQQGNPQLNSNPKLVRSPFSLPTPKSNATDTSAQINPPLAGDSPPASLRPLQSRKPSFFSSLPAPKSLPSFPSHDDDRIRSPSSGTDTLPKLPPSPFSPSHPKSSLSDTLTQPISPLAGGNPPESLQPLQSHKPPLFSSLPAPNFPSHNYETSLSPSPTSVPSPLSFHDGSSGVDSQEAKKTTSSSSIFFSLPLPRSSNPLSLENIPSRRIVQIAPPPIDPSVFNENDSDEDERERKKRSEPLLPAPSAGVKLTAFLPAPKNSLGTGLGSSVAPRISIQKSEVELIQNQVQEGFTNYAYASNADVYSVQNGTEDSYGNYDSQVNYGSYGYPADVYSISNGAEDSYGGISDYGTSDNQVVYENYENYQSYGGDYGGNSGDGLVSMPILEVPMMGRSGGKRGRNEAPVEIVEVNQDELMKNRPREDQVKLTGIAFGPSRQPTSSGRGKPSKLHRRKHQIGSLYYDMKEKEMELTERRSRGMLTKAETQGKYGW